MSYNIDGENEDIFDALKKVTNVSAREILRGGKNSTLVDIENSKNLLMSITHTLYEALENGVSSNIYRSALWSTGNDLYYEETKERLKPDEYEEKLTPWLESKEGDDGWSEIHQKMGERAIDKIKNTITKINLIIHKALDIIAEKKAAEFEFAYQHAKTLKEKEKVLKELRKEKELLEIEEGKMAQDAFNNLLEREKKKKKNGQYIFYEPKGLNKKGKVKEFPKEGKGGRRTRKRKRKRKRRRTRGTKKKRRKRNFKKRTRRRR